MKAIKNTFGKFINVDEERYDIRNTTPRVNPLDLMNEPRPEEEVEAERQARRTAFQAEYGAAGYTRQPLTELEITRITRKQDMAKARFREEVGMITLPNGIKLVNSPRVSLAILMAYIRAQENPAFELTNFKLLDGTFVTLDKAKIEIAFNALGAHVADMFAQEAAKAIDIDLAVDEAEVNAIVW